MLGFYNPYFCLTTTLLIRDDFPTIENTFVKFPVLQTYDGNVYIQSFDMMVKKVRLPS